MGAGAFVRLDEAGPTRLSMSVRQEATDPIYWNAPRDRWSVGVSHSFGNGDDRGTTARSGSGLERRVRAPEVSEGRVTIHLPVVDRDEPPSIAGDFTSWEPVAMVEEDGRWTASFQLEPGVYRYAFRSPSGHWYVPESVAGRKPDGFGGCVAVLVIP